MEKEEDELLDEMMEDAEEDEFIFGMYQYAMHIDKYLCRAEHRVPKMSGIEWVHCHTLAFKIRPESSYVCPGSPHI